MLCLVVQGRLSHLHIKGHDKKGQIYQVLKLVPIRWLSRKINITVQVVIELRKSFSFDCGTDVSQDKCVTEGDTTGLIFLKVAGTCVDANYNERVPH